MKNNYLLIDVMNMVFRYYYTPLSDRAGKTHQERMQNIDLYVSSILQGIIKKHRREVYENPNDYIPLENIILAQDSKSWRHELVDDYKGTRSYDPEAIEVILAIADRLEEVAKKINITVVKSERIEADDAIAMFVKHQGQKDPNAHFTIVTNDDDYTQLKDYADVTIYNPIKKAVNEKCGKMALAVKTLEGDDSDNIKKPMINLNLNGKSIDIRMGKKTILQSMNGRFYCKPPNNVEKEIKYHNKSFEIATICSGKRNVLFSSEKCSIEFDDNYKLSATQKLKFDKSIEKERQEELDRRMHMLIEEIIEYGDGYFEIHQNYKEDFINQTITALVEKFKKEHKEYIKQVIPELTKAKEISQRSEELWFDDLIRFNEHLISSEQMPQTQEELIKDLSSKFEENINHNEVMIDFKNIPQELRDNFEQNIVPEILSKKQTINRQEYLENEGLLKLAGTIKSEEEFYKRQEKKVNQPNP